MQQASVRAIIRALNEASVEYLIAGELAVVAHGYVRFTKDVDLVLRLERANTLKALAALKGLGYQPMVATVKMEDLADPEKRKTWVEEKDATVFTLYSDEHRLTPIDIFIEEPFDFSQALRTPPWTARRSRSPVREPLRSHRDEAQGRPSNRPRGLGRAGAHRARTEIATRRRSATVTFCEHTRGLRLPRRDGPRE